MALLREVDVDSVVDGAGAWPYESERDGRRLNPRVLSFSRPGRRRASERERCGSNKKAKNREPKRAVRRVCVCASVCDGKWHQPATTAAATSRHSSVLEVTRQLTPLREEEEEARSVKRRVVCAGLRRGVVQ